MPKPTAEAENERVLILRGVGECLAAWSTIEVFLSMLLTELLESTQSLSVDAMLSSIPSFRARLNMVNRAVENHMPMDKNLEFKKAWGRLYNKLGLLNKKRNEIAHFSLVYNQNKLTYELQPFSTISNWFNAVNQGGQPRAFSSRDINVRVKLFDRAAHRIYDLYQYFSYTAGKLSTSALTAGDLERLLHNPIGQSGTGSEPQSLSSDQ